MKIEKTTDYSKFKLHPLNREVTPDRQAIISAAIKHRNLTQDNPILVDHKGFILMGQGRYLACKELGLPIYYFVASTTTLDDIPVVDSIQTKWTAQDFVDHYVKQGKKEYIKLQSFMDEFGLPISASLVLLADIKHSPAAIRQGTFKAKRYDQACEIARQLIGLKAFCKFYNQSRFVMAFARMAKHPKYKHKVLIDKLKFLSSKLTRQADREGYSKMLSEIYNYKARKTVNFEIAAQEEEEAA